MEDAPATVKMILQYDGADFHGFQKQKTGERTVQGEIEKALGELLGRETPTIGSSRTDARVHAVGQVVSFESYGPAPPEKLSFAVQRLLPRDLSAVSSSRERDGFNARTDAKGKTYVYACYRSTKPAPFLIKHALNIPRSFDPKLAAAAMERFVGTHDFSAYENQGSTKRDPVRTIEEFTIVETPPFVKFAVTGSGFLYKMVRNMCGAALEAGMGKTTPERVSEALKTGNRKLGGPTLPPQGLYLVRVYYSDDRPKGLKCFDFI